VIDEWHRIHPEIEIAKRMLGNHSDTKRLIQNPFVCNTEREAVIAPSFMRYPNKPSYEISVKFMRRLVTGLRFVFAFLCIGRRNADGAQECRDDYP
jgi:hypothetical protein